MDGAEPGRLLAGRYELRTVIGRGGMGTVWRARDKLLDRDVAVKELVWPPGFSARERETACRRASREAQMAARLNHPNVIRVYDIVEEDGHPWIVMELLPYQSLRDLVAEHGRLPPARAARVGLGILAALAAAHAEGIMHRDVKPANVLIGPDDRVVLTDFGIARAADSTTLTTAGMLIGSPSYMAPERARGEQSSAPGDLWGLGASLYAAVEGRPPFERENALACLTAVVADEPEPATHAGPLRPVITGLLRKDPHERLNAAETGQLLSRVAAAPGRARADQVRAVPAPAEPRPPAAEPRPPAAEPRPPAAEPCPPAAEPPAAEPRPPAAEPPAAEPQDSEPRAVEPPAAEPRAVEAPAPPADRPAERAGMPRRRLRPALAGLAALVVLALAATGVALALTRSPGRQTASPPASTRPGTHAATPPGSPRPGASHSPAASPGSGNAGSGAGSGAVPAGWYRFTNSTGFSIGVPQGWQVSHVGHYVYIRDPDNGGIFLLIDQSDQPKPNPLADWQQQAAAREGSYPDYHQIRLESVNYAQAEKAADWEFTYDRDGTVVHILNRNILANARHAYALYWSTPESDWNAYYRYFQSFAATFRPAPA